LCEDGVIFISIDDSEASKLKELCDEIFWEENFVSDLIWEKRFTRNNDAKMISTVTEHILFYRKGDLLERLREPRSEKNNSIYSNPDNDPRGDWTSVSYVSQRTKEQRKNLAYPVINPFSGNMIEHPSNAWKYSKEQYELHAKDNRLYWGKDGGHQFPRLKRFLSELNDGVVPVNLWNYKDTGTIDDGTKVVDRLLGKDVFDYPKPVSLLRRMLKLITADDKDSIVMDFFAGSGTTAQSVLEFNKEDGGRRKFVLIQLPELIDKSSQAGTLGFRSISSICKERIRMVLKDLEKNQSSELNINQAQAAGDLGFRVFTLATSNFKIWNTAPIDAAHLPQLLLDHVDNIQSSATPEDILYELLLKSGFQLTTKVKRLTMAAKEVFSIQDGAMLICLDKELTQEVIDAIADANPLQVICLDKGFRNNDQLKTNAVQTFKARAAAQESEIVFKTA
jgi:adenine-specific DNA-methyltransferase